MGDKKFFMALLVVFIVIGAATAGVKAAVNNATVTAGSESSYNAGGAAGSSSVTAGGTTEANVSATLSTSRWAGFYGSISTSIVLADAASNWFRNWTVSNVSGAHVYASNVTTPDFSVLAAASETDMPSWLTTSGAADNYANTFNQQEASATFNGQALSNVNYALTYDNTGTATFKTYSLKDSSSDLIWAALAQNDATGYNGNTVDYQLLVPVNDQTPTTYYFFLELP